MDITNRFPKYQAYPPVPNWYSSNVTAIVDPHLFLYATRNLVVVLGLEDLKYFNSFAASNDKVQAIAAHETFCFTAGVDKIVRGWNILLGSLFTSHDEHNAEVTALKLIRQGTVLISGDKSGKIVIVETFGKLKHSATKVKSEITCISTTTHDGQDYIAVGYANGMIFVEHVGSDLVMTTQFQIANDNDMIQSLDWQKLAPNVPSHQTETTNWPLLASSTKRKRNIFVWTFPSQSLLTSIRLPNPPAQATEQQKSTVFIELAWSPLQRNKLYLSSYIGSIVCFDITNRSPKINNNERLERHNRNVFTINWYNGGRNCITTSLDKQVIKWDVAKKSCLQNLKTQTGFPYSLDISLCNQGQLAIGMGDNSIKLWNFSNAGSVMKANKYYDYYDASVLWKGLQGKIEKIKWHPNREGFIAYGNEYGHVGIYDTLNLRHIPFKSYHKSQGAPFIDWGLNMSVALDNSDMQDTLLSCGGNDGIVHVYNINHPQAPPVILNDRLREKNPSWFSSLEAKNSYRHVLKTDEKAQFIAFGHTDGLVEVYRLDTLKLVFVSNCQRRLIKSLDWKYTADMILLASGCDQGDIAIHKISTVDMSNIPDIPVPQPEAFQLLKGHKKSITDLKWCLDQTSSFIASASEDNFVAVWDIIVGKNTALFSRHRSRVLSVCWSPSEPGVLFTGSEDRFIYQWNMNDFLSNVSIESQSSLYDTEKNSWNLKNGKRKADTLDSTKDVASPTSTFSLKKKPKKPNASKVESDISSASTGMPISQESEKFTSRNKKEQYCLILADKIMDGKVKKAVDHIKNTYLTPDQSADPTISKYVNFWQEEPQPQQNENIHDLFFGDKNDVRRLIEIEAKALNEKEANSSFETTYTAKNYVKNDLDVKLAIDIMQCQYSMFGKDQFDKNVNSCMSDWIILALSPMVGKETWINLMLEQAKKLESLKQYHLSASCYIACTNMYEAIEVYRKHFMFREAIALAKLRLPPRDPIVDKLFAEWANELQKGDSDTLTASCYIMSNVEGSKSNAINALARSGKETGLFYAACLATAAEDSTQIQRIEHWLKKLNDRVNKKAANTMG